MGKNIKMIISVDEVKNDFMVEASSINLGKVVDGGAIEKLLETYKDKHSRVYCDICGETVSTDDYGENLISIPADEFLRGMKIDNDDFHGYNIGTILLENSMEIYGEELKVIAYLS